MARPPTQIATRPTLSQAEASETLERLWGLTGELDDLPSERDQNFLIREIGRAHV